ncbi:hypothetical protein Mpet_1460 [Methanolacinia petrolearia DSM 11571]|uniref:Uncharacterized protein n=1 Tax=Methanolacinia petrolearia (strain DSM 11571 / OCM 486 / SEBR 4847) TaxID=679926 RepID=E1RFI9_METP4|nr:hypothetical protein [Methanolacinia petrolearia]ADN36219.1 hypothetical protein Mpet_1460 [Methanolacinia petrolearia DSM 11571]
MTYEIVAASIGTALVTVAGMAIIAWINGAPARAEQKRITENDRAFTRYLERSQKIAKSDNDLNRQYGIVPESSEPGLAKVLEEIRQAKTDFESVKNAWIDNNKE